MNGPLSPFTATLLRWFETFGRDLPWRRTHDAYAIWLSEIILQQTRISQGQAYWERFMRRWPTVSDLAAASEDEVLKLWQGLGYYSRARNLLAAALQIVGNGRFPDTYEDIIRLKGVGEYTAAAIASFAFGIPKAVVDGNVFRVLSRFFGINEPIRTGGAKKTFTALAQSLLPEDRPADFNQAIMDFGALQCVPKSPHCEACPLQETCVALRTGKVGELPVMGEKVKVKQRRFTYIYLRCQGKTAFRRRSGGDIWQGLWEPFLIENGDLPRWNGCFLPIIQDVKHVLTHRVIHTDFYLYEADTFPELPEEYVWMPENEVPALGIPRLVEKLLGLLPKSPAD